VLALVEPHGNPEGLFFPDSYHYVRGDSDWQVLQRAHRAMLVQLQEEWEARAPDLPYETPYEALVMASIVEKETGLPEERSKRKPACRKNDRKLPGCSCAACSGVCACRPIPR
jgi:UPF0755 protein